MSAHAEIKLAGEDSHASASGPPNPQASVSNNEQRVLILAPTANDARLAAQVLQQAGLHPQICRDVLNLCAALEGGVGAILLAEEALTASSLACLAKPLARMPPWSDIPIVIVTSGGEDSRTWLRRFSGLGSTGSVVLVERPFRSDTLTSVLQAALRSRQRQYQVRDLLAERSRQEEALRREMAESKRGEEARAKLAAIVESSEDAIIGLDLDGMITSWNAGAERLYGYAAGEMIGHSVTRIIPFDIRAEQAAILERLRRGQGVAHYETVRLARDGHRIPVSLTISPIRDAAGAIIGYSKTARDITKRKAAEAAAHEVTVQLRESERQFHTLADSIPNLAWWADGDGYLRWYNRRWYDYTGTTSDQMEGWGWQTVHHPDHVERVTEKFKRALAAGEPWEDTFPLRAKGGEYRWFLSRAFPIRDVQGNIAGWFGTNTDITELRDTQLALDQARAALEQHNQQLETAVQERTAKLQATIGELEHFSYTLTHDMRAPLRAMQGFGAMLRDELGGHLTPESANHLDRIMEGARRMDLLIQDSLQYATAIREIIPLARVDPVPVLRSIVETYPGLQSPQAEIHLVQPFLPVIANEAWLSQCFSNLLINAIKFVKPGKVPKVRIWSQVRGNCVRFWFEDNGIGIPAEYHKRIFIMFQQLDKSYGGTGIGLALVRKTAERMSGAVGVESEPGQGSRFWLELPLAQD